MFGTESKTPKAYRMGVTLTEWMMLPLGLCLMFTFVVYAEEKSRHFEGKNVAEGKNTWQYPGDFLPYSSSLAVDGDVTNQVPSGHCSHTSRGDSQQPYWVVDLGKPYFITGIRIYNRQSTYRKRLRYFKVEGSATPNGTRHILYNDEDKKYMQEIIDIEISGTQEFQEVDISIPIGDDAFLTLCEVMIYVGCNPVLLNGIYSPTWTFYGSGSHINVTCNDGYRVDGSHQRTCQDGQWLEDVSCKPDTCSFPSLEHGWYELHPTRDKLTPDITLTIGQQVSPRCDTGYDLANNVGPMMCEHNGQWTGSSPQCLPQSCKVPDLANGFYVNDNGNKNISGKLFSYNTTTIPRCKDGFRLTGTAIRRCVSSNTWDQEEPVCEKITCKWPLHLTNGRYISADMFGNSTGIGVNITAECDNTENKTFKLESSADSRTCQEDGEWSGENAKCVPMCRTPTVTYGRYHDKYRSRDFYVEGHLVQLFCFTGYELTNGEEFLSCQSDHAWNGTVGECTVVHCALPTTPRGHYSPDLKSVKYFDVVTFHCEPGFMVVGYPARFCQANKNLDGPEPYCKRINCRKHDPVANGRVWSPDGELLQFGSVVNISCNEGFLGGPESRTCQGTGQWSGPEPECRALPFGVRYSNVIMASGIAIFALCVILSVVICVVKMRP